MRLLPSLAISLALCASAAPAKTITVKMLNQGKEGMMVFEPSFVTASVGDVVHFVPTNPSHNAETISTMLPGGVTPSHGAMNKEFVLPLPKAGIYGIKCKPHFAMGMVALIQVGKGPSANLAQAKGIKLPGLAGKRMTALLAKAK